MRKTVLMTALIGATLAAVPASAQSYGRGYGYSQGYDRRGYGDDHRNGARQELWQLGQRVDRGIRNGDLTRREADYFRREIAQLRDLDQRYSRGGGYSWREQQRLDQRIDRLRQRLRYERRDDDRSWDRRGYDDRRR